MCLLSDFGNLYDSIFRTFPDPAYIGKAKLGKMYTLEALYYNLKSRLFVYGGAALFCYFGLMHFPWKQDPVKVLIESYLQFLGLLFLRDLLGMMPLHTWMHRRAYFLHKVHHTNTKNISIFLSTYFDWADLFFENVIGTAAACVLLTMFGKVLLVPAFFIFIWHDQCVHSLNPYAPIYLNPVLDYFFRDY